MKRVLILIVTIFLMNSCSPAGLIGGAATTTYNAARGTSGSAQGTEAIINKPPKDNIFINQTTKKDVTNLYGKPFSEGKLNNGMHTIAYIFQQGKTNTAAYIPVVSIFKGKSEGQTWALRVTLDVNDVVVWYDYKYETMNYTVRGGAERTVIENYEQGVKPEEIIKADADVEKK